MTLKELMPDIRKGMRFGLKKSLRVYCCTKNTKRKLGDSDIRGFLPISLEELLSDDWESREICVGDIIDFGGCSPVCLTKNANVILYKEGVSEGNHNFFKDLVDYKILPMSVSDYAAKLGKSLDWVNDFVKMSTRMNK